MSKQKTKIICIIKGSEVHVDEGTKMVILIQHLIDGKRKGEVSVAHSKNPVMCICRLSVEKTMAVICLLHQ